MGNFLGNTDETKGDGGKPPKKAPPVSTPPDEGTSKEDPVQGLIPVQSRLDEDDNQQTNELEVIQETGNVLNVIPDKDAQGDESVSDDGDDKQSKKEDKDKKDKSTNRIEPKKEEDKDEPKRENTQYCKWYLPKCIFYIAQFLKTR